MDHDKVSVEQISLGSLSLAINGSTIWGEENRAQRLLDYISSVREDLITKEQIPACSLLRLVSVTNDITAEIGRWQRQLGEPVLTSTDELGEVVGKTLTWGDGEPESTFAVIILAEGMALGMLEEGSSEAKSLCVGMLAHELTHVHDYYRQIRTFGKDHLVYAADWGNLCREIAINMWSEFHAESVAYSYAGELDSDSQVLLAVNYVRKSTQDIQRAIATYRLDRDMPALWSFVTSTLSKTLNQVGRAMGLLSSRDDDHEMETFFGKIDEISLDWGVIARKLTAEFKLITETRWNIETFSNLGQKVERVFHASGLYPKGSDEKQGLWVDVP